MLAQNTGHARRSDTPSFTTTSSTQASDGRGSEFFRGGLAQDPLLKRKVRHRLPQPLVLVSKLLQALHLVALQPTKLASRQQ